MKKKIIKKRKGEAIASIVLNLFFWIPVLSILFSSLAIILGIKALIKIKNNPSEYGGKVLAFIGIVWGAAIIILSAFFYYYFYIK